MIYNEEYVRKVLPFIRPDYFSDNTEKIVFKEIFTFINQYKNPPTHEALVINFTEKKNLTEPQVQEAIELLNKVHLDKDEPTETQWLIEQTEKFCQDKAIYNAIMESVSILDSKSEKRSKGEIPQLLSDALENVKIARGGITRQTAAVKNLAAAFNVAENEAKDYQARLNDIMAVGKVLVRLKIIILSA